MTLVHISDQAEADLDAIWLHIAIDSPLNADRLLERLVKTLTTTLSTAPLAGQTRDEFEVGLRSFTSWCRVSITLQRIFGICSKIISPLDYQAPHRFKNSI